MAQYREDKTTQFINPYNFVSINYKKTDRNINAELINESTKTLYTGYFDCELVNKTPLAIPDINERKEDKEHKEHYIYPALKIKNDLIIPGSSLRGPIRSMYETLTNSCMVTMKPMEHITRRSNLGSFFPCVLKYDGEWRLFKAKRIALVGKKESGYKPIRSNTEKHIEFEVKTDENGNRYLLTDNKEKICFGNEVEIIEGGPGHCKKNKKNNTEINVWSEGSVKGIKLKTGTDCFLFLGEMIDNKHAESVFKIQNKYPEKISADCINNAIKALEDTLLIYRSSSNRKLGESHFGYRGYEKARDSRAIPLWYKYENGKLYLSLAAIGRITYQNDMSIISNGHSPCTDRKSLCPACSLFGMAGGIGKNNNIGQGLGSHIRITDALLIDGGTIKDMITLKELGSPNPSYLPFYSTNNMEYDKEGATIRGRKYYWHNTKASSDSSVYMSKEKTNRNTTMELIDKESKFGFRVYYNDISEEQLSNLAWTITLGGNDTSYMYKIGHGKPLGLGSCKIKIIGVNQRTYDDNQKYSVKAKLDDFNFTQDKEPSGIDKSAWDQIKIIADYIDRDNDIVYPFLTVSRNVNDRIKEEEKHGYKLKENVKASHKWFGESKDKDNRLPNLNAKNITLNALSIMELEDRDFIKPRMSEHNSSKIILKEDEEYKGIVIGYNKDGTGPFAQVRLDNNGKASFFDKNHQYNGSEVILIYKGKIEGMDGILRDKWELK